MRIKTFTLLVAFLAAVLLLATPLGAQAAKLITGKQIKDSSLTGKDVKDNSLAGKDINEGSLGRVPSAKSADSATTATTAGSAATAEVAGGLAPLGPGETQSGAFSAASGSVAGLAGYLGFEVNFPRPLPTALAANHIVDTDVAPDPVNCPGPGEAAAGYLCLYFEYHNNVDSVYGNPGDYPYSEMSPFVGIGLYAEVTGEEPYVDGIWTVTAPEIS